MNTVITPGKKNPWVETPTDQPTTHTERETDMTTIWESTGQTPGGKVLGVNKVRVTEDMIYFETDSLTKNDGQQVPLRNVYDVDTSQEMWQKTRLGSKKLRGTGNMKVRVRRDNGDEETVVLRDMPDYRNGAEIITSAAKEARLRELQVQQTTHYSGQPPVMAHAPAPQSTEKDPREAIRRLRELMDEGLISEDEYNEKRSAILDRL